MTLNAVTGHQPQPEPPRGEWHMWAAIAVWLVAVAVLTYVTLATLR